MIGEAELVCIAAAAAGASPAELLARCDMGALARVVAELEATSDAGTLEAAGRVLMAVTRERPFPDGSNRAAAWLAAAVVLEGAGFRQRVPADEVVPLLTALDEHTPLVEVMVALERLTLRHGRRVGWLCPACGREIYVRERREGRVINVGVTAFELTSRCWYEHREHDRRGRPLRPIPVLV